MTLQEYITAKLEEAKLLHDNMETVLSYTSPEDVMEEATKRDEFKLDLQKVANKISDEIAHLESLRRTVNAEKRNQTVDMNKLDRLKWDLLSTRKRERA